MILYYSETGNSEYAAKKIAAYAEDETLDIREKIENNDYTALSSLKAWVIVVPTYAWRMPKKVEEWLKKTELLENPDIYFVMTCGGSIGAAPLYAERLAHSKKMTFKGCTKIAMPERFAELAVKEDEASKASAKQVEDKIREDAGFIKENYPFKHGRYGLKDKFLSSVVNYGYNHFYDKGNKK